MLPPWHGWLESLRRAWRITLRDLVDMIDSIGDWEAYLALDIEEEQLRLLRQHGRTGRPLGSTPFILQLEETLGRFLRKRKPGPKGSQKPVN